ncbi:radical SAM protein [Candidatus Woesearchaeota archaeon CG10_big_fil_rev_8_21_14_0_10_47_5]|nr:MAG: hypothetical protein AUJ69_01605 [Candidatus Woesearchaeota archaeon CG1_02_47_18]PIN72157.1 MAG: radical SAM protein [Candidatus Woesearchaeota archaeon CG10_big_fil_rev_8_21_14_0_10_47_5]
MRRVKKTAYYSWLIGSMPKGCELCVRGRKLVLFVTGLCPRNCYYCPLSDTKKNLDVTFANEWKTSSDEEIITEARLCSSRGAGITGGDPLVRLKRTLHYIKLLKSEFDDFHIHLYTSLKLLTKARLRLLYNAGLDEIRVHPKLEDDGDWQRIRLLSEFKWDKGIEIPVIPGMEKETRQLIDYAEGKVGFINLNELEIADNNASKLLEQGFVPKDRSSYAVKGSHQMAMRLMRYLRGKSLNNHYCTARLKDRVQLASRIKLRARSVAQRFDRITPEGTLIRGVIYASNAKPGFSYHKNLTRLRPDEKKRILKDLKDLKTMLSREYRIRPELLVLDNDKPRLLTSPGLVEKLSARIKQDGFCPAIVEEYPTKDAMEVEVEFV